MRPLTLLSFLVLCSVAAFSQVVVDRGEAGYGFGPFVPLVTTPSVSLGNAAPVIGASNATEGLSAGASNGTLSMPAATSGDSFSQTVWYGGGSEPLTTPTMSLREGGVAPAPRAAPQTRDLIGWTFLGSRTANSLVEASAQARAAQRATRTYTNDDINRLKDMPLSQQPR